MGVLYKYVEEVPEVSPHETKRLMVASMAFRAASDSSRDERCTITIDGYATSLATEASCEAPLAIDLDSLVIDRR